MKIRRLIGKLKSSQSYVEQCRACQWRCMPSGVAWGQQWSRCEACGFMQAPVHEPLWKEAHRGEGMSAGTGQSGSITPNFRPGTADGGYREYYISKMCMERGAESILLYGTGNTPTLDRLIGEGIDVHGCDFSEEVIASRRQQFGDIFFHPDDLPDRRYDAIVAVEVLEHFIYPLRSFRLLFDHLSDNGAICGTTDFQDGSDISDHIYLKSYGHVAYWSEKSMSAIARFFGRDLTLFELVCPGSVKPDEKFGLLWPRKRVFAIHPTGEAFFPDRKAAEPILPIDKP